ACQARRRRKATADTQRESVLAVLSGADEHDAIDFGRVALRGTRRDRDLVFAREIEIIAIAEKERDDLVELRAAIEQLVGGESGHRAASDVADGVAAATQRGQSNGVHGGEDFSKLIDLQPVELDVLTG